MTASVAASNASVREGLVKYNIDSSNPIKYPDTQDLGRDNYFNKELIPAYAHSYLLTSILSNDYVDITGDGITDDDLGDAIKLTTQKQPGLLTLINGGPLM